MQEKTSEPVEIWSKRTTYLNQHILQWLVLISFFCLAVLWAYKIKFNNAPDELMRYMIPKYIYTNGSLPTGTTKEVIYNLGNWSYAYYPQWLGPITSALFMKIVSLFNDSASSLLFGARLTSVFSGTISLFILGKIIERVTSSQIMAAFGMALIGFLPQYMYLSSYVNNDIISVIGVGLILLVMLEAIDKGWTKINCAKLSVGFIICFLSYLNSYGFILGGGIYFLITSFVWLYQHNLSIKSFLVNCLTIFVITGIIVFPFLIRNYILYHDIFGVQAFHAAYVDWLKSGGRILQIPYQGNLWNLLTDIRFLKPLWTSLIGQFGYMTISMNNFLYNFYSIIFVTGFSISIGFYSIKLIKRFSIPNITDVYKENKMLHLFSCVTIVSSLITIILYLYYCLGVDFQPQGRYLISLYLPAVILITYGYKKVVSLFTIVDQSWLITGFILGSIILNITVYKVYITGLI